MAEGNRKRSNKGKKTTKTSVKKAEKPGVTRVQRVKDTKIPNVAAQFDVQILQPGQVQMMKEAVNISNTVGKLINQQQKMHNQVYQAKQLLADMKSGKIKTPLMQKVGEALFIPIYDINQLAKTMENEQRIINETISTNTGQLSHWYDEYVSSLVRLYHALDSLLGDHKDVKSISGHTKGLSKGKEAEEKKFIKDFDLENPEDVKAAKKAVKEAVKANERATSKSGKKDS